MLDDYQRSKDSSSRDSIFNISMVPSDWEDQARAVLPPLMQENLQFDFIPEATPTKRKRAKVNRLGKFAISTPESFDPTTNKINNTYLPEPKTRFSGEQEKVNGLATPVLDTLGTLPEDRYNGESLEVYIKRVFQELKSTTLPDAPQFYFDLARDLKELGRQKYISIYKIPPPEQETETIPLTESPLNMDIMNLELPGSSGLTSITDDSFVASFANATEMVQIKNNIVTTPFETGKKKCSSIWKNYTKNVVLQNGIEMIIYSCNHCNYKPVGKTCSVSNLRRHMFTQHKELAATLK